MDPHAGPTNAPSGRLHTTILVVRSEPGYPRAEPGISELELGYVEEAVATITCRHPPSPIRVVQIESAQLFRRQMAMRLAEQLAQAVGAELCRSDLPWPDQLTRQAVQPFGSGTLVIVQPGMSPANGTPALHAIPPGSVHETRYDYYASPETFGPDLTVFTRLI